MTLRQNQNAGSQRASTSPTRSNPPSNKHSSTTSTTTSARRLSNAPMLSTSSSNNHSHFAFNRNGESGHSGQSESYDFLPSVSFDDLHASIESASSDFKLAQFPSPNGEGNILDAQMAAKKGSEKPPPIRNNGIPPATNRNGRSGSVVRRSSMSSRQPSTSSIASSWSGSVDAPTAASSNASRGTRRQSHYPPVSNTNNTTTAKPPRKSLGPGILTDSDTASRTTQRRRPSVIGTDSARTSIDGSDPTRRFSGTRAAKVKSVMPPPKPSQTNLTPNISTPDTNRHSLASRSPRVGTRGNTPSSGNKRASMMPGSHGLGARTISPTDTRRMKRMSMMPQASSQPQTQAFDQAMVPPAPVSIDTHSGSHSPALPHRKASATPSSARGTPDHIRRSFLPGTAAGATTASASSTQRLPQVPPTARLPPQKHQNVQSSSTPNDEGEDVPPVPAIPKAYESPKETPADTYFMEKKKSVTEPSVDVASLHTNSTSSITMPTNPEPTKVRRRPSARKSSFGPGSKANETTSSMQSKKTLPPLTLPPLNLGPINFPAPAKTANSQDTRAGGIPASPPASRQLPKTPTTPMTASKSSFFSKSRYHDALEELPPMRSSSSIHQSHRVDSNSDAGSSSSSMAQDAIKKPSMSPFLSSSLPKSGGFEHDLLTRAKTGDYTTSSGVVNTETLGVRKPSGPRPPQSSKQSTMSPPPIPAAEEPATPSSMSSLRGKLSLSWKRGKGSASGSVESGDKTDKAPSQQSQTQSQQQQQQQSNAKKQEMMPPPRIPVSATSYNLTSKPKSPVSTNGSTSNLARRRKSSASSLNHTTSSAKFGDAWSTKKDANESLTMPVTRLSTAANNMKLLKPKTSATGLRQATSFSTELDKDDMAANEEMRKMGSRRKETDIAARTLDALKKRASPKERVGPQEAIRIAMLNIYERGEIIDYNDVYFCGTQSARKVVGNLQSDAPNFGYDDERGDYTIVPGDHLSFRYEIVDILGKGSFGQVVRCIDHKHGTLVAVKIIRNKKRFHQQALVEVNILQKLREWDPQDKHSMVNFTQSFYFRGHLCISTELLDMNLYEFIKAHSFRGFSLRIVRRFTKQILSSLILLKKRKVIHCDLKPENILLRHPLNSELKVIDFGSSCFEHEKVYTYIQSRFYRSPEVILGMTYGLPIDMWSVGCILAELFTGVPIFPGENEQEQLACIMEVFGPPEKHLIEKSTRRKLFFDSMGKPRLTVSSKGRRRRPSSKSLQQVLKCDDEAFIDFLARCLRWDPERRLKPEDAVRHEFITGHKMPMAARMPTRDPSPVKRSNTLSMPRPLPDPPGGKPKVPGSFRTGSSPQKHLSLAVASSRRASVATSATAASLNRRTSAGPGITASSSGLPRIAGRSASGKPDLAAAGATAAMNRRN